MDQMQTVPGPSQAAFNTLNNQMFKNKASENLTEADDISLFGLYVGKGSTCHGLPSTGNTYYFLVGIWNVQLAITSGNTAFYERIYINNAWSSWRELQ